MYFTLFLAFPRYRCRYLDHRPISEHVIRWREVLLGCHPELQQAIYSTILEVSHRCRSLASLVFVSFKNGPEITRRRALQCLCQWKPPQSVAVARDRSSNKWAEYFQKNCTAGWCYNILISEFLYLLL